jgi:hypothetical protein
MADKQYKYTTTIGQPQTVGDVKLDPKGGSFSEREYKTLKKDAYGTSLLEKGLLVVKEEPAQAPALPAIPEPTSAAQGEDIPDFEGGSDLPKNHTGGKAK